MYVATIRMLISISRQNVILTQGNIASYNAFIVIKESVFQVFPSNLLIPDPQSLVLAGPRVHCLYIITLIVLSEMFQTKRKPHRYISWIMYSSRLLFYSWYCSLTLGILLLKMFKQKFHGLSVATKIRHPYYTATFLPLRKHEWWKATFHVKIDFNNYTQHKQYVKNNTFCNINKMSITIFCLFSKYKKWGFCAHKIWQYF